MAGDIDYDGGLTLSVSVANMDDAIGWYQKVLGFALLYRLDEIGWCELSTGVARVNLGLSVTEKVTPGGATPTFGVKDIETATQALESHGVKLDGEIMTIEGMVKFQTFYDPDGNTLMFFQDLSDGSFGQ